MYSEAAFVSVLLRHGTGCAWGWRYEESIDPRRLGDGLQFGDCESGCADRALAKPAGLPGVVMHVRTRSCGGGICGQIERVKNRQGYDAPSRAVGRRVLVNLVPEGDGSFAGQVWEPSGNRMLRARMQVQGNIMRLENCSDEDCRSEIWRRLR